MNYTDHAVERLEYMLTQSQRDIQTLQKRAAVIGRELRTLKVGRRPQENPLRTLKAVFEDLFHKMH